MSVEPLNKINSKLYYMQNKDKCLEANKKWREKNKDKVKAQMKKQNKKYYESHKEEIKAKAKARREQKAIELKALQEAISRQCTNNYPQIFIQDVQSGRVFEFGKSCHDRLVISEDGRSLHYANLQCGDGSEFGGYRFYYENPTIETEMDKAHEYEINYYARHLSNMPLEKE